VWDLGRDGPPEVWASYDTGIEALAWSADGAELAVGLIGGDIHVRDRSGHWSKVPGAHPGGVTRLAFTADGRLVSVGWDGRARLHWWNGDRFVPAATHACSPVAAYSPALHAIACGPIDRDGTAARVSDSGRLPVIPTDAQNAIAFSPNGQLLAIGRPDYAIELLAWDGLTCLHTFTGHTWVVYGLAISPDGRTLVSGSADHTTRLWDVASGALRAVFRLHASWVTVVAFAPDGLTVASAGADRTVAICDVE
jgi:WD40 repeat protein